MLVIFLFLVTISYFIYTNQKTIRIKDKIIEEKNAQISRLEDDIRDYTKGLWREFGPLNTYKKNEYLLELFQRFCESNPSVISIQLYNYFEQRDSKNTLIKIKHALTYVMESKNLNSLQQHYYKIPTELLKKFEDAVYMYRGKSNDHDKKILEMYIEISEELDKLKIDDINTDHAIKFAFLILIHDIFGEAEPDMKEELSIINNDENERELFHLLRTGILRGILYDKMFYRFNYIKTNRSVNSKSDRAYLTIKSGMTNGKQSILVVTVDNKGREIDFEELGRNLFTLLIENGFN
ncbi:hypothetical protein [Aeribacillus alveayuensis]|uniref:Uncharacterized protein n=1 Tax=Aeribacillus alveayuensis TaxID=279215 RepID=A0ABT9VSU5_9BACI|nr:hypothetical protein [Bacillus alveayuensis]